MIWEVSVVIFSLALLIFLALRGFSIIIIAPLASITVILLNQMPLLETLQEAYMGGFINFAKQFFFIFLLAAMFGKFMEDSGAAIVIAKGILKVIGKKSKFRVLVAVVAMAAVLTYGGVAVHIVIFAMLPIAKPLFRELNIPWHLFMAAFFFGAATFSMTMLPGTPAIHNVIPTKYFGTTVMAGPLVGIVATIAIIILNCYYLKYALKKSERKGETYWNSKNMETASDQGEHHSQKEKKLPPFLIAIIPPVVLLTALNFFKIDVVYSLMLAVVVSLVVFWPFIENKINTLNLGATNTVLPIVNTSADVGYGAVIATTAGFAAISDWLTNLPGSPLISLYSATSLLSGITGSGSGGIAIAMEALANKYMQLGLNPEVLHRIAVIGSGGFDALPHNGGVITFLIAAGLTHKDAYKHVFITGVIAPTIAAIPALIAGILFY
ncbi:GntP family permease [Geobacillus thermodenitrificans]|uniref:GntP family permease n=1 Tax=Geobacillus thermodenitrificans TaxID=33940 RepID=UPI000A28D332|nr:SLC13 family permease [Geobacillus thermodenitrificans]ARP41329.1 GntP family permease [Geobacillus thermodenitrificans]